MISTVEGIVRAQTPSSSLISLADARLALAQATDVAAVATLVDRLEVVRLAARKARLSLEAQNDWATLKLEAERKAGGMLTELRRAGELRAGRPNNADNVAAFLSGFGISQHQSSRTYRRPGVGSSGERASGRGALTHLGPGRPARRNGYDRIIEVYPAAALHEWRYLSDHYKGTRGAAARARIVQKLGAAIPGLDAVTEECGGQALRDLERPAAYSPPARPQRPDAACTWVGNRSRGSGSPTSRPRRADTGRSPGASGAASCTPPGQAPGRRRRPRCNARARSPR